MKKKIVIFGSSQGGLKIFAKLSKEYEVIAFCDNSTEKQGLSFCGLPTISPEQLVNTLFDEVFIASQFIESIYAQLITLKVAPEKIRIATFEQLSGNYDQIGCYKKLILFFYISIASVVAIIYDRNKRKQD